MFSTLLLVALLAADVPSVAGTPAPASPPPAAAPDKPKADPMVCHNEKDLGSNLPHRVCHHQSEIDARAEADRATVQQMQNTPH